MLLDATQQGSGAVQRGRCPLHSVGLVGSEGCSNIVRTEGAHGDSGPFMTRAWSESARARGICSALVGSRSLGACEDAERLDSGPRTGLVQRLEGRGRQGPTDLTTRKRPISTRRGRVETP